VEQLSDTPVQELSQLDTFFHSLSGRLKLRELADGKAQLIHYERPDQDGPKRSDYTIFETREPESLKAVLTRALGVRGVIRKVRSLYMIGQTRLHLDVVEGLGEFLELEVVLEPQQSEVQGRDLAEALMDKLGLDRRDLQETAYMDLLERAR